MGFKKGGGGSERERERNEKMNYVCNGGDGAVDGAGSV